MRYGFALPAGYDRSRPLVIDPGLAYATFLGGAGADDARAVAVGPGRATVAGYTASADFPATPGAFDTATAAPNDGFVARLSADGTALAYSTFLGGGGGEWPRDRGGRHGRASVAGCTDSPGYPTTAGAYDTSYNGGRRRVRRQAQSGRHRPRLLDLPRRHGGRRRPRDRGRRRRARHRRRLDRLVDFPATRARSTPASNGADGFVDEALADGDGLAYSTFLGGRDDDHGRYRRRREGQRLRRRITSRRTVRPPRRCIDTDHNNADDGFVAKLAPSGRGSPTRRSSAARVPTAR